MVWLTPCLHTTPLSDDGLVYTWGHGHNGRLGHGDTHDRSTPTRVQRFARLREEATRSAKSALRKLLAMRDYVVASVACGGAHTVAVTQSQQVWVWGAGSCGQLGLGSTCADVAQPRRLESLLGVRVAAVAAGQMHTCAVTHDSMVYSWGWGELGVLGHPFRGGADRVVHEPRLVEPLAGANVFAVACGATHSAFLTGRSSQPRKVRMRAVDKHRTAAARRRAQVRLREGAGRSLVTGVQRQVRLVAASAAAHQGSAGKSGERPASAVQAGHTRRGRRRSRARVRKRSACKRRVASAVAATRPHADAGAASSAADHEASELRVETGEAGLTDMELGVYEDTTPGNGMQPGELVDLRSPVSTGAASRRRVRPASPSRRGRSSSPSSGEERSRSPSPVMRFVQQAARRTPR